MQGVSCRACQLVQSSPCACAAAGRVREAAGSQRRRALSGSHHWAQQSMCELQAWLLLLAASVAASVAWRRTNRKPGAAASGRAARRSAPTCEALARPSYRVSSRVRCPALSRLHPPPCGAGSTPAALGAGLPQRAPKRDPRTRAAGFGQPDARTGHVVVQLRTSSAVDLLRYACSPRIIPISTSQINSNRHAHHPHLHSS
jgi:hypothetical protein